MIHELEHIVLNSNKICWFVLCTTLNELLKPKRINNENNNNTWIHIMDSCGNQIFKISSHIYNDNND